MPKQNQPPNPKPKSHDGLLASLNKLRQLFNRRDKVGFCVLLVCMIIGAGLETFSIGIIPAFISAVINPDKILQFKPAEPLLKFLGITTAKDILLVGSLSLIIIFLFKNIYLSFLYYIQIRYTQNRRYRLSRRMFSAYMYAPYHFHLQRNSAELFRNINQEVMQIIQQVLQPMLNLTMQGLTMIAILALLLYYQPLMALVATLVIGLAGGGYQWWIKGKLRTYSLKAQKHRKLMVKAIQQGLGVIKEIRVLHREKTFIQTLEKSMWQTIKAARYQFLANHITQPYMEFISVAGLLSIAILLVLMGHEAETIAPTLILFAAAFIRLKPAIASVVQGVNNLRFGVVSIDPIHEDLTLLEKHALKKSNQTKDNNSTGMQLHHRLDLEGVWYRYPGSDQYALKDITLTLPKGHSIAFVGSTGAGKTTIVDVILGLLKPEKGRIAADGMDIHDNLSAWQRNIGYIPQFIYLTDDTIRHNVALGLADKNINEEQLQHAIQASQLETFVESLPQGLDTVIGENGIRLSGGQRQRIGIARALYHNPEILVMDEATSSLDNVTEKSVIMALDALKKNRTIIMIAHRLTTVQNCDVLYYIKNGKIESSGTYNELIKTSNEFKALAIAEAA